jgi:hypothetical protein
VGAALVSLTESRAPELEKFLAVLRETVQHQPNTSCKASFRQMPILACRFVPHHV